MTGVQTCALPIYGIGMEPAILESGKESHFGLQGMRERAARIGGTIEVTSASGSGTTIVVTVPGRVIYAQSSPSFARKIRSALFGEKIVDLQ